MVNNIYNPKNCYFKIHGVSFLQSQQVQVQNIQKLNAITSICNTEVQNQLDCTGLAPSMYLQGLEYRKQNVYGVFAPTKP